MAQLARYPRGALEFDRVSFFTDAVFAIAMTLLIVSVEVPKLSGQTDDFGELLDALSDIAPQLFSFFLAFLLLANYWMAQHSFVSRLRTTDVGLMTITMVYLAMVAFLPFPTDLIGEYWPNPLAIGLFAASFALISSLEAAQVWMADRRHLFATALDPGGLRYGLTQALIPAGCALASIPIAFVLPGLAIVVWILAVPLGAIVDRMLPAGRQAWRGLKA